MKYECAFSKGQFTLSLSILCGLHVIHCSMPLGQKENKTTSIDDNDDWKEKNIRYCNGNVN